MRSPYHRLYKKLSRKLHVEMRRLFGGEFGFINESAASQIKYRGMKPKGFRLLGSGCFSMVFEHDYLCPGIVFKYNVGNHDASQELGLVLMELDHPNLPRVYGVFEQHGEYREGIDNYGEEYGGTAAVTVIERLEARSYMDSGYKSARNVPGVDEACDELEKYQFYAHDLHDENVMWRPSDGNWVVTDPTTCRG